MDIVIDDATLFDRLSNRTKIVLEEDKVGKGGESGGGGGEGREAEGRGGGENEDGTCERQGDKRGVGRCKGVKGGSTSLKTMEATCLVMSVPAIPMAIPQSAFLIATRREDEKRREETMEIGRRRNRKSVKSVWRRGKVRMKSWGRREGDTRSVIDSIPRHCHHNTAPPQSHKDENGEGKEVKKKLEKEGEGEGGASTGGP